ncbi:MAG TPA: SPOR domain-containing protein [Cyclobacteriaceae bacterium]|nr:SPOR domain-containing protein [Cyclobacteriaceae bacterium]
MCPIFFLLGFSCTAQWNKPYHEDLSKLRPKIEQPGEPVVKKDSVIEKQSINVKPVKTVNAKVDEVLDSLDLFNLMRKFIDGYTIQIYSGQKREDAMNTKKKLLEEVPDLVANLQYQQPKFRVTVGRYLSKLEAQKDLLVLRRKFSAAILVPEKIPIK